LDADKEGKHAWVLFFDERMKGTKKLKKFERDNVIIKHFPFIQYRQYLPVLYSHMLISSFLTGARLDVFHSPEGLIPFAYPGNIVTTFHYVPRGESESNLFVRTFMLGARTAFAQLCKRAKRIIVNKQGDKKLLLEKHGCNSKQVVVMEIDDLERVDWSRRVAELHKVYAELTKKKMRRRTKKKAKREKTKKKKETRRKVSKKKTRKEKK